MGKSLPSCPAKGTSPGCSSSHKVKMSKRGINILPYPGTCCPGQLVSLIQQALLREVGQQFTGDSGSAGGCSSLGEGASPTIQLGPQRPSHASSLSSTAEDINCPAAFVLSTAKQPITHSRYGIHAVLELFTIHMQHKSHHLTILVITSTFQRLCIVTETIVFSWFQVPKKSLHTTSFMPSSSSIHFRQLDQHCTAAIPAVFHHLPEFIQGVKQRRQFVS